MKKTTTFLLVVFFSVMMVSNTFGQEGTSIYDADPQNVHAVPDTTPAVTFPYPTVFNFHYSTTVSPQINGGTVGAMFLQGKYYLNRWNSTTLYRYNGGLLGPTTLADSGTYQGSIRDLATDGTFLYGGAAAATVYKMDANGVSQGTIALGGGAVARALAYSPDENAFFASNFSDDIRVCNATTGALIRTLTGTSALAAKYGMGYSNVPPDGPTLWVWGQGSTTDPYNNLWKVNPQTGAVIAQYKFGPLPPSGTSIAGIAGGMDVCNVNGSLVLLMNYQNYALQGCLLIPEVPVELSSFTAFAGANSVELSWETATETNNLGFEVQRLKDNGEYATIAFVNGNGSSTISHSYSFIDRNLVSGKYNYRLKQVDLDGRYEYSKVIELDVANLPTEFSLDQNFPNPFNPATVINVNIPVESKVSLVVFNAIGQKVAELANGNFAAGTHSFDFNAAGLNSGIYFYNLIANGADGSQINTTKKMILTK